MKAVSLNGSARGGGGITGRLLASLEAGLGDGGCHVRSFVLRDMEIGHCASCFSCMHAHPGVCSLADGMARIHEALKSSDILVAGTPLYTDSMSSRMKALFDRCICAMEPFVHRDGRGRFRHSFTWRMPARFVLVSACGFPEMENFAPLSATLRAQAYNFGSELAAEILVPGSIALQMEPGLLEPRCALVREAGRELGRTGSVPQALLERISRPVVSPEEYLRLCGEYEEWCRRRLGRGRGTR
ncbi:MAG: flavodoxin family protein [Spirochaetes bacterium]|nr:flavodoxin family protein [Spirochaetota bacterium]